MPAPFYSIQRRCKMHPSSFCVPLRYVQSSPPAWINSSSNSHPLCLALYPETHVNCLRATSVLPIFPVPPCILCTPATTLTATCLWRPKWLRSRQQWTNTTQNTRLPSPKQRYCKRAFGSSSFLNQRVTADACPAVPVHRNYTLGVSAIHLFLRRAHLLCVMQIATKHDHATLHARRNCLSTLLELSYSHHLPHRFIIDYALLTPMPLVLECRQPASRLISATAVVMRSPAKHYGHRKRTRLKPLGATRQRRRTSSHTCLSHRRKTHKTVQRCSQMLNHHHPPRPTAITAPPPARPNQTHFLNQRVYPAQAANSMRRPTPNAQTILTQVPPHAQNQSPSCDTHTPDNPYHKCILRRAIVLPMQICEHASTASPPLRTLFSPAQLVRTCSTTANQGCATHPQ